MPRVTNTMDQSELQEDLYTLALFIRLYCRERHTEELKSLIKLEGYEMPRVLDGPMVLCPTCAKLLQHAFYKRSICPMDPKPACKHCPSHCYHPSYRKQIREVMQFSGKRLLTSGRLDLIFHLLF